MSGPTPTPEPKRRPMQQVGAARKDNIVLARLMTAPHGRTVKELTERMVDEAGWVSHDRVYASLQRLQRKGLIVRHLTPVGYLYQAVAPDPDDPLEQLFAAPTVPEISLTEAVTGGAERSHKTRRAEYTHEEIIAAIMRWTDAHGEPPKQADWNPAMLRLLARKMAVRAVRHLQRVAVYDAGAWPSEQTVRKYFGSWNAALAAAGYHEHLRSSGNQPREGDLSLLPGTGAADGLERLLGTIIDAHHGNNRAALRSSLLDLSLTAREWAMSLVDPSAGVEA